MDIWFGIVEDLNDPKQLGRVKVRLINEYSNKVLTDDIPWATPMLPITNPAILGLGQSPVGIEKGSRVIGIYLDGERKSKLMVIGTYPIIMNGNDQEHSVNNIARGKGPVQKDYLDYEPRSAYAAEYPHNKTITTKSGHVIEIDDTPKSERINIHHKSGSYIEFFPDGSIVSKSCKTSSDISMGDKTIISDNGDFSILSNNKQGFIQAYEDLIISSDNANVGIISKVNTEIGAKEKISLDSDSEIVMNAQGDITIKSSTITIDADNIKLKGNATLNGKPIKT
jgi:hypothetical protein